jgi:hypothetical protein
MFSNAIREDEMTRAAAPIRKNCQPLAVLLEKAADTILENGSVFVHYAQKLNELADRYSEGRFHPAVLGQFKRGKSTLLNALTRDPILPVGVVPLTAAPTFIQYGETAKISVQYQGGRPAEEFRGASTAERCAYLARFVTEKGNPQNKLGIAEVQVDLPAAILSGGVVLIDTRGIGSTYRHNTTDMLQNLNISFAALPAGPRNAWTKPWPPQRGPWRRPMRGQRSTGEASIRKWPVWAIASQPWKP